MLFVLFIEHKYLTIIYNVLLSYTKKYYFQHLYPQIDICILREKSDIYSSLVMDYSIKNI